MMICCHTLQRLLLSVELSCPSQVTNVKANVKAINCNKF